MGSTGYRRSRPRGTVGLLCLVAAWIAAPAQADYIELVSGEAYFGETVEETRHIVRFRCAVHGIWTTLHLDRGQVLTLIREDGDQSDRGTGGQEQPANDAKKPEKKADHLVAVIPLHGRVGGMIDDGVTGTFDAGVLRTCLEEAEGAGADLVILDIVSPGGLVSAMEAICQTIVDWHDRMRIVAFPRAAYSAAAIISLSCRELAVRPDSELGAAVIITQGRNGPSAVDAKMASPHHARQRQFMAASGQPYAVVQAMTIQETQLWWSPVGGFTTTDPAPGSSADGGAGAGADWELIDGRTTILTLTGDDTLRMGLAIASARSSRELAADLGLSGTIEILDLGDEVKLYNTQFDRRFAKLREAFEDYFTALLSIANGMNELAAASRANNRALGDRIRSRITSNRTKALGAARKIRKSDRSLIARRVDVSDVIVERMEEDARLLGRIPRLLDSNTIDGFNKAADRLNEVIRAWRELLK